MLKIVGISALLVGLAAPAPAQDLSVVEQAIHDVSGRDTVDPSNWCQVAEATNLVAWRLWTNHAEKAPYGLLRKVPGQTRASLRPDGSCVSGQVSNEPDGFVGLDYLIERASGFGRDIITSWGAAIVPEPPETTETARNWDKFVDPVDPSGYLHTSPPVPPTPPPPTPPPSPAPVVIDLSGVQAQLTAIALELREHVRANGDALASINQNITDGRAENRSFFASIGDHWKAIVGVIGPIYATWQTCHNTGKC